jgi:hypothetical protein
VAFAAQDTVVSRKSFQTVGLSCTGSCRAVLGAVVFPPVFAHITRSRGNIWSPRKPDVWWWERDDRGTPSGNSRPPALALATIVQFGLRALAPDSRHQSARFLCRRGMAHPPIARRSGGACGGVAAVFDSSVARNGPLRVVGRFVELHAKRTPSWPGTGPSFKNFLISLKYSGGTAWIWCCGQKL